MGNMDPYIDLVMKAKIEGGPEELIEKITADAQAEGFTKGVIVTLVVASVVFGAVSVGVGLRLKKKYKTQQAEEIAAATVDAIAKAEARGSFTVHTTCEMPRGLTLTVGDKFRALTRTGDMIMLGVEGRTDNPLFVSGVQLEQVSDFKLDDIDEI